MLSEEPVKYKYACLLCKKDYTRKSSLEKHKILCEYKSKSKLEIAVEVEEAADKPTYDQLVKIVQELSIKYIKMEEKVSEMQHYIDRKKKKVDIIGWLNDHIKPTTGFLEWVNIVVVVEPFHFLRLLKPEINIFDCLQEVFEFNLLKKDFVCPIKCFTQKNGTFYIYDANDDTTTLWKEMILSDFISLLKLVQKKLIGELSEWRKENKQLFRDNDKVADQFNKAVIKLMSISFSQDPSMSRVKNGLFHYLKTDLDCLV
jgi:hypothetical protein